MSYSKIALLGLVMALAACAGPGASVKDGVRGSASDGGVRGSTPIFNASFSNGELYEKSYALVIGIDNYQYMTPLTGGVRDAEVMAKVLSEEHNMEVVTLLDKEATRRQILKHIGRIMARKHNEDDRVLIYYAGHGVTSREGTAPMGYLMPVDGEEEDPISTGISMSEVRNLVKNYKSKHLMFIADACFSGLAIPTTRGEAPRRGDLGKSTALAEPVFLTLVAGRQQDVAREWRGHGLFTYFLIEALRGNADLTQNGIITSDELIAYLKEKVMTTSRREWNTEQLPQRDKDGEGEFVFWNPTWSQEQTSCPEGQRFDEADGCVSAVSPLEGVEAHCWTATECLRRALIYTEGSEAVQKDPARALVYHRSACALGHLEGCEALGRLYTEGQWGKKLVPYHSADCKAGDGSACFYLGEMNRVGWSMEANPPRAMDFYNQGCDKGYTLACVKLGGMFIRGEGAPRNLELARNLFDQACRWGNAQGCSLLGTLYLVGVDRPLAKGPLKGAVEALASMHVSEALELFEFACDSGHAGGCSQLGKALTGVENAERRSDLFRRACALGDKLGCKFNEEVVLARAEVAKADLRAANERRLEAPAPVTKAEAEEEEGEDESALVVQSYQAQFPELALQKNAAPGDLLKTPAEEFIVTEGKRGSIIRDEIVSMMRSQTKLLALCALDMAESLPEKVDVSFEIMPGGKVSNSRLAEPYNQTALGDCVNATLRAMDFGELCSERVEVRLPISLR